MIETASGFVLMVVDIRCTEARRRTGFDAERFGFSLHQTRSAYSVHPPKDRASYSGLPVAWIEQREETAWELGTVRLGEVSTTRCGSVG